MLNLRKRNGYWEVFNTDTGHCREYFDKRKDAVSYCEKREWNAYHSMDRKPLLMDDKEMTEGNDRKKPQ